MIIRMIRESDAEQLLHLRKTISAETPFLLLEPDEITLTAEEQRASIATILENKRRAMFVIEQDKQLIGLLGADGGEFRRNKHSVYIFLGILQAFTGQGIGTQLLIECEAWARQQEMTRIELTVITDNQAGIALYKKRGFEIEGTLRRSLFIHGRYVDQYAMAKLLD